MRLSIAFCTNRRMAQRLYSYQRSQTLREWIVKHLMRCSFIFLLLFAFCLTGRAAHAFDEDHLETINGARLHFRVRGTDKANPYLLILHGGPGFSCHMFYGWGASLEQKLNVVYLDQRGCGESQHLQFANPLAPTPQEARDYTFPNLIKDIEGVRDFLKVNTWYVLGHSWGGMLGIEYVAAHPEHVAGFIIMDGLVSQPLTQDAILDRLQARYEQKRIGSDPAQKASAESQLQNITMLRLTPPGPTRLEGVYQYLFALMNELYYARPQEAIPRGQQNLQEVTDKYHVSLSLMAAIEPQSALMLTERYATRDDRSLLAKITPPTLIINGKQDGLITPALAELTHVGISKSKLLLYDDCGHFPFVEQPQKTTQAILTFIRATPAPATR